MLEKYFGNGSFLNIILFTQKATLNGLTGEIHTNIQTLFSIWAKKLIFKKKLLLMYSVLSVITEL